MVRHPFERIVSAFQDKFVDNNSGVFRNIKKKMISSYGDASFISFVKMIIASSKLSCNDVNRCTINRHWKPFIRLFFIENILFKKNLISVAVPIVLRTTPLSLKLKLLQKIYSFLVYQQIFLFLIQVQVRFVPQDWQTSAVQCFDHNFHYFFYILSVTHVSSGGSTKTLTHKYFSLLELESIKKLYDLYKIDFELFDYNPVEYFQMAKKNLN